MSSPSVFSMMKTVFAYSVDAGFVLCQSEKIINHFLDLTGDDYLRVIFTIIYNCSTPEHFRCVHALLDQRNVCSGPTLSELYNTLITDIRLLKIPASIALKLIYHFKPGIWHWPTIIAGLCREDMSDADFLVAQTIVQEQMPQSDDFLLYLFSHLRLSFFVDIGTTEGQRKNTIITPLFEKWIKINTLNKMEVCDMFLRLCESQFFHLASLLLDNSPHKPFRQNNYPQITMPADLHEKVAKIMNRPSKGCSKRQKVHE